MEGKYFKALFNSFTVNIILNDQNLKSFPLRSGTKQVIFLFSFFIKIFILETPASAQDLFLILSSETTHGGTYVARYGLRDQVQVKCMPGKQFTIVLSL